MITFSAPVPFADVGPVPYQKPVVNIDAETLEDLLIISWQKLDDSVSFIFFSLQ